MSVLALQAVSRSFAGIAAVSDVSFSVAEGAVTALIGPNGAGKTTLINLVTGVLRPSSGQILYHGEQIDGVATHRIAQRGLRRTFQTVHLFTGLTVLENMVIGQYHDTVRKNWWRAVLPFGMGDAERRRTCMSILERFDLATLANVVASELPFGVQRRVEIARALAGHPTLLLLDEPAAGMNEQETERLRDDIRDIGKSGVSVLLIEHDMSLVMAVAERVIVLNFGEKIAEGTPDEVRADEAVVASYLGA